MAAEGRGGGDAEGGWACARDADARGDVDTRGDVDARGTWIRG